MSILDVMSRRLDKSLLGTMKATPLMFQIDFRIPATNVVIIYILNQ